MRVIDIMRAARKAFPGHEVSEHSTFTPAEIACICQQLARPLAAGSPLQKIMGRYVRGAHLDLSPDEVARLVLYQSALEERLRRLEAAWISYREQGAAAQEMCERLDTRLAAGESLSNLLKLREAMQREFEQREEVPA